ncbi:hypothetical protein JXA02_03410, partial [candidate division KSB1 bacterium]|nr:hypothetical protein [candidate division KSB1 bacterium]
STGGWCYEGKSSDQRTFFVAPCTDFVIGWGEDLQLVSDTLTIEYDTTVIEIAQGETKTISLAEDSPFLVNGQLPATVKYGLKNKTTKNLKFILLLNHGGTVLYQKDVAFCGESTLQEQQRVTFSPSAEPLMLTVEAGDMFASPSDDTRAVFFNGNLQLYVYPL